MIVWTEQKTEKTSLLYSMMWEHNPRKIHVGNKEKLVASMERFGIVEPVVANKRNSKLISGHQRVRIGFEENLPEMLVTWVDLSDAEHEEMALVLNNEKAQGHWDEDKLAAIIQRLGQHDIGAVTAAGFSREDISRLLLRSQARSENIVSTSREQQIQQSISGVDAHARDTAKGRAAKQEMAQHAREYNPAATLYTSPIQAIEAVSKQSETYYPFTVRMSFADRTTLYQAINKIQQDEGIVTKALAFIRLIEVGTGETAP